MKKIIYIIMPLMLAVIKVSAYNGPTGDEIITLSHQGQESYFGYNELQKAIDKAIDGDTVYFSAGYFVSNVILTKKLSFIGVAASTHTDLDNAMVGGMSTDTGTYLYGTIRVQLPENTRLTSCLIDGIYLTEQRKYGSPVVLLESTIDNVIIKRCFFDTREIEVTSPSKIKSIFYDRCVFFQTNVFEGDNVICQNCSMGGILTNESSNVTFNNCTVVYNNSYNNEYYVNGIFNNCIIKSSVPDAKMDVSTDAKFTNCLFLKRPEQTSLESANLTNCYLYELASGQYFGFLSQEELLGKGYLGTDKTVVGCYGGSTPLTLIPFSVKTSQTVHIELAEKQVQINIKVSSHN